MVENTSDGGNADTLAVRLEELEVFEEITTRLTPRGES